MSKITEELKEKMKVAMKEKNAPVKSVTSIVLSKLALAEKENKGVLSEEQEINIIAKELKQIKETLDSCVTAGRIDLEADARIQYELLEKFMPEQLSEEEVLNVIEDVLQEININIPKKSDKGTIMKVLMPRVKGKVDGSVVNKLLANMLQ